MMTDNPTGKDAGELSLLIDAATLARWLDVSIRTVRRRITENKLPKAIRVGGCMRWLRKEVEEWIAAKCPDLSRCQKVRGA